MDPYRARTVARFAGLAILVVFAIVLALMQRTLVSMKAERGGNLSRPATTGRREPQLGTGAARAARELLGPAAAVRAASDIDGDGGFETLAIVPAEGGPPGETWARRIGVVAASSSGGYALLFDSGRPRDLPQPAETNTRWRVLSLDLRRLVLEPVGPGGAPMGEARVVTWESASGRYSHAALAPPPPSPSAR